MSNINSENNTDVNNNSFSKYRDPDNIDELMNEIKECPNISAIMDFIHKYIPGWFVTLLDSYSGDYPHFQETWIKLCIHMEISPTKIMIVDEMIFDDNHKLIRTLSELFTRCGFSVKRKLEFIPCEVCGRAIPTEFVYQKLKRENRRDLPEKYSEYCTSCVNNEKAE